MTQASLSRKLCAKYPEVSTHQLSRMLYEINPALFRNVESARSAIRYTRGLSGKRNRERHKKGYGAFYKEPRTSWAPQIPQSLAVPWVPFRLPDGVGLVISDLHIPFHSTDAIEAAVKLGKKRKVNWILLNGDVADFYMVSKFDKVPGRVKMRDELTAVREFLAYLQKTFPGIPIFFKLGNHDERLDLYVYQKAPELAGIPSIRLPHILTADYSNLPKIVEDSEPLLQHPVWEMELSGITFIGDQRILMAGELPVLHGHELGKAFAPPVNAARGAFLKALSHVFIGHSHQRSEHSEKTLMGKIITTYSAGCLCNMTPEYARVNKWSHGAALIEVDGSRFFVENRKIIDGVLY
jgi:predicted phosphodiesterase